MRAKILWKLTAVCASLLTAASAHSENAVPQPVVVELFTSQGCSSCPPADAFLKSLKDSDDDLVLLSLHVDYWNRLGWKDEFSAKKYTDRQRYYALKADRATIYTPQMVIQGQEHAVGSDSTKVGKLIESARQELDAEAAEELAAVNRLQDRPGLRITVLRGNHADMIVSFLKYQDVTQPVDIGAGENRGRTIEYTNVVTGLEMSPLPRRSSIFDPELCLAGSQSGFSEKGVILIQDNRSGKILYSIADHDASLFARCG
ncbi:MAG: DUF1223 domain-containing protein [Rhodobacteraceae bacterium]|nr:DUF1223 domain-containing protein [Paracoccaceae bacterium]